MCLSQGCASLETPVQKLLSRPYRPGLAGEFAWWMVLGARRSSHVAKSDILEVPSTVKAMCPFRPDFFRFIGGNIVGYGRSPPFFIHDDRFGNLIRTPVGIPVCLRRCGSSFRVVKLGTVQQFLSVPDARSNEPSSAREPGFGTGSISNLSVEGCDERCTCDQPVSIVSSVWRIRVDHWRACIVCSARSCSAV